MGLFRERPELLTGFRRGDADALTAVYWAYIERVERIARYGFYLSNKGVRVDGVQTHEIGDLVQEIFARAFAERARLAYDGLKDYGPYLATIARNLLVDWARRGKREISLDALGTDFEVPDPEAGSSEPDWADPETVRVVEAFIAALPPDLRAVHNARYVDGLSQQAAVEKLGISRQQLRTREQRLRDGLAEALEHAGITR